MGTAGKLSRTFLYPHDLMMWVWLLELEYLNIIKYLGIFLGGIKCLLSKHTLGDEGEQRVRISENASRNRIKQHMGPFSI